MAVDGHPWLTPDLDEQRARQRRILAGLPERTIGELKGLRRATGEAPVEVRLRNAADKMITDEVERLCMVRVEVRAAREAWSIMQDATTSPRIAHGLNPVEQEAIDRFSDEPSHDEWSAVGVAELGALSALLVWADQIADDDYVDHRVDAVLEQS